MKLSYLLTDEEPRITRFIRAWRKNKRYTSADTISLGEVIELLLATTRTYYKDDSDGRFFNNSLQHEESSLSWDGTELIDILFFEVATNIKHILSHAHTINDTENQ